MTNFIERDKKRRILNFSKENIRLSLKSKFQNQNFNNNSRRNAQLKLYKLPKNSSLVRVKNRCSITGRSHGIYRKYKLSRIMLKKYLGNGDLIGLYKSSW